MFVAGFWLPGWANAVAWRLTTMWEHWTTGKNRGFAGALGSRPGSPRPQRPTRVELKAPLLGVDQQRGRLTLERLLLPSGRSRRPGVDCGGRHGSSMLPGGHHLDVESTDRARKLSTRFRTNQPGLVPFIQNFSRYRYIACFHGDDGAYRRMICLVSAE